MDSSALVPVVDGDAYDFLVMFRPGSRYCRGRMARGGIGFDQVALFWDIGKEISRPMYLG